MIENKISIRPNINNIGSLENKKPEEKFQNETLRPIIKLQHDLLVAHFDYYLAKKKIPFLEFNDSKKKDTIINILKNDILFKTELRSFIIGHFTLDEYQIYLPMNNNINKRIMSMIKEKFLILKRI